MHRLFYDAHRPLLVLTRWHESPAARGRILVNMDQVAWMAPSSLGGRTLIMQPGSVALTVEESLEDILAELDRE